MEIQKENMYISRAISMMGVFTEPGQRVMLSKRMNGVLLQ